MSCPRHRVGTGTWPSTRVYLPYGASRAYGSVARLSESSIGWVLPKLWTEIAQAILNQSLGLVHALDSFNRQATDLVTQTRTAVGISTRLGRPASITQ